MEFANSVYLRASYLRVARMNNPVYDRPCGDGKSFRYSAEIAITNNSRTSNANADRWTLITLTSKWEAIFMRYSGRSSNAPNLQKANENFEMKILRVPTLIRACCSRRLAPWSISYSP
jgi:hypothetical protein